MDLEDRGACGMPGCPGALACLSFHFIDFVNGISHLGYSDGSRLRVHKSPVPGIGLTVTSLHHFKKGATLTVYDGYLLHRACTFHAFDYRARSMTHTAALDDYVVSGLQVPICGRGVGSFINHNYAANCLLRPRFSYWPYYGQSSLTLADARVLLVVAKYDIFPGDELSLRYDKHTCLRLGITYKQ